MNPVYKAAIEKLRRTIMVPLYLDLFVQEISIQVCTKISITASAIIFSSLPFQRFYFGHWHGHQGLPLVFCTIRYMYVYKYELLPGACRLAVAAEPCH